MKKTYENHTSEYIVLALLQLMKKKSFSGISITELCEKAGVSRMSFYRYYESKQDVLKQECARITDEFVAKSGISYRNNPLKDYFIILFTHLYNNRDLALLLERADQLDIVKDDFQRVFLSTYKGVYEEYKSYYISGGLYDVFCHWLRNGFQESPEELAAKLRDILEK